MEKIKTICRLIALLLPLVLTACPDPSIQNITTPTSFTQKVLIEEYTGTWCGYCPDGAYRMQLLVDAHPGVVIGAAYHDGDPMEIDDEATLAAGLGDVPGFPMGSVSRASYASSATVIMSRGYWPSAASLIYDSSTPAPCGLKIVSSLSGRTATITVSAGFREALSGDPRLGVFLTEDGVTMTDPDYYQHNYYNDDTSSPFYGRGDPTIPDFVHMHVVRAYVTDVFGDSIGTANTGTGIGIERSFTYVVPDGMTLSNMHVIAFVATYGSGPADRAILNVQEAALDATQDWD
jgi:hypothetical protein